MTIQTAFTNTGTLRMELSNTQTVDRTNNDMLDLLKFILSFFIVAIHTNLYPRLLYPWLRIAVPMFFLVSSYLLFSKLKRVNKSEGWKIVFKTAKRLAFLYLFWLVVLLPITVYVRRGWFSDGPAIGMLRCVREILFGSSFIGSWYIVASIWAIFIIYFTNCVKHSKSTVLPLITVSLIYLICCLSSSYYFLIENNGSLVNLFANYERVFSSPVLSFPVAIFWMTIGKLLAEDRLRINKIASIIILVLSAVLLYFEWRCVYKYTGQLSYDCLAFLTPVAVSLFVLLKDLKITIPQSRVLRKMSTITYCSHASVALVVYGAFKLANLNLHPLMHFGITLAICHLICWIFLHYETQDKLSFLKYSH